MNRFDRKFGPELLNEVPNAPGVYRFLGADDAVVYVGKAKRLRRRLAQYRNASRLKRHRKMRAIVSKAVRLVWEVCESELDASLREIRLIQELRPKANVAGKFSFLYPLIGLKVAVASKGEVTFAFTTEPARLPGFLLFGSYRSREATAEAFFALMRLLRFVGHLDPSEARVPRSYLFRFRRLGAVEPEKWTDFFRGFSREALEDLALALVDKAGARAKAAEIEEDLKSIGRFWKEEALPLARAIDSTGFLVYPVPQAERDPLFLRARSSGA